MGIMIGFIGIIVTIISIIIGIPAFMNFMNSKLHDSKKEKNIFKKYTISKKIVLYIWGFPTKNEVQASWAIKESQVLLGNLENAKKKPGLGISILSVEFAQKYFKNLADSKINNCINWGIVRTQKSKPYFILYEKKDENITSTKFVPDFRHTIALGILLSRTKKHQSHIDEYIKYLITNQHNDGGWTAGQGFTTSELFSCIYAIELLMLNFEHPMIKDVLNKKITKTIKWLIDKQENNLWESGVFPQYDWDKSFASTWVLNRLIPFNLQIFNSHWFNIVIKTSMSILNDIQTINWIKKSDLQRFRIEARVAAALHKGKTYNYYSGVESEQINSFLEQWKIRTKNTLKKIEIDEFDLATALFIAEPLLGKKEIIETVKNQIPPSRSRLQRGRIYRRHLQCE